jgi:uncharacterized protein (DUF488 family)
MNAVRMIWTIGHSNHTQERLLDFLRSHSIGVVADLRTSPCSRYSTQFNKEQFERALESQGIRLGAFGYRDGRPAGAGEHDDTVIAAWLVEIAIRSLEEEARRLPVWKS